MKAKSIKGSSAEAIDIALEQCIADNFRPTLAIVFLSAHSEREAVCKILSEKNIRIFGSSTGSEFIDEEVGTGTIAVLLLDTNPSFFYLEIIPTGTHTTKQIAEEIGKKGLEKFRKPSFMIISAGLSVDGDEIVEGIKTVCGSETPLFGGLAADDTITRTRTYVFTNDEITEKGLLALIFDGEKVSLTGMAIGGWRPMGMERTITRSEGNIVYTIDNEPVLDFIARYSGIESEDINKTTFNLFLSINFQVELKRENKHAVMRTPMLANYEERSITFAGSMPQGSKVRLSLLPGFEVVEEVMKAFRRYKEQQPEADALVIFSCAGRQYSLGPYASKEIGDVKKIWDAPAAGFFCFGEIGKVPTGVYEFHNMTFSLAILKEN
jgi:hypothetical protein